MIGELAALGAALTWTFSAVLYKEALLKTKPISANIVRLVCISAILIIYLMVIGKISILTTLPLNAVSGMSKRNNWFRLRRHIIYV
ncbi:MAG: hypothetical protein QXL57_06740 [Candidatus Bathyarchaeia archaeon]